MSVQFSRYFDVRIMRAADIPAVLEIERSAYDYPWSERIFHDCLRVGYRAWVVIEGNAQIVGYALLSVAAGESHILNLCIADRVRGRGIAELLIDAMIAQAEAENAEVLLLEVRPSNKSARRLYKRLGFERIATRPAYYPAASGREDALLLCRRLDFD